MTYWLGVACGTHRLRGKREGFAPYRVDVAYVETAREAPIRPLPERLELTRGLANKWGMAVRGSKARLSEGDFRMIAEAMDVPQSDLAPPA
ncbi:MAG: hypothetical protein ACRBBT_01055 [Paracoccaceae bacterium]